MSCEKQQFILLLLKEGREWASLIIPALVAWHLPRPAYMHRKAPAEVKTP